jgi:hypothetical protein
MHGAINVKSPNNTNKWQMGFDSAFKGLMLLLLGCHNSVTGLKWSEYVPVVMHRREKGCSHLHKSLNIEPIPVLSHPLTDKYFAHCLLHPKPLFQQIGNYNPAEMTKLYKKYKLKRIKHKLLCKFTESRSVFFHNFSLPLFAPMFINILFSSTCITV